MRVAIVLWRGIEGCWVTRACINLQNYFDKNNIQCESYASNDRKRPRRKNQQNNIIEFSNNEIESLSIKLNEYDYVYFASLPSKNHWDEYCELFEKHLIDWITKAKKIMIQHDHNIMSLNRNYHMWEITSKMDLAFNFSKDSSFSTKAKDLGVFVLEMINWFEFDKYEKYIKPVSELKKRITYFWRFATFKDPIRLIHMHEYLKMHSFVTELRWIERSIWALPMFYSDIASRTYRENVDMTGWVNQTTEKVHLYWPYVYEEWLENTSQSAFGANFYNLRKWLWRHVEFATLELTAIWCLPVVDKWRAEKTEYKPGINYIDIKDAFVFSDKTDLHSTVIEMNEIFSDLEVFERRRKKSLDIFKEVFNLDKAYWDLFQDTNKYFTSRTSANGENI